MSYYHPRIEKDVNGYDCYLWNEPWVETHVGCVLSEGEHNYHDDSDGYAIVWDGEKVIEVPTWTTRGAGPYMCATVDATDEVKATVTAWAKERRILSIIAKAAHEAATPGLDKVVVVARGRKVPKGTTGKVVWAKMVNYDPYGRAFAAELRVGIEDADGTKHYTAAKNCEVVEPSNYLLTREQAEALEAFQPRWNSYE